TSSSFVRSTRVDEPPIALPCCAETLPGRARQAWRSDRRRGEKPPPFLLHGQEKNVRRPALPSVFAGFERSNNASGPATPPCRSPGIRRPHKTSRARRRH